MNAEGLWNVREAAAYAKTSERTIRRWCEADHFKNDKEGKLYWINPDEFKAYVDKKKESGQSAELTLSDDANYNKTDDHNESVADIRTPTKQTSDTHSDTLLASFPTDILIEVFRETANVLLIRLDSESRKNKILEQDLVKALNKIRSPMKSE